MRIAIDCRMLGKSGIGVFLENILNNLISTYNNHNYLLIGSQCQLDKYKLIPNCTVLYTNIEIFSLKEQICFPVSIINECDLYFSPNFNIPPRIKIPVYSTIHDIVFLDVKGLTSFIGKAIRKFMIYIAIKRSKKIFTVSNFSKNRIEYYFNTKDKIIVTYNGLTEELINAKVPTLDKPFNDYILFVGNIKTHKGIGILLKAYLQAKNLGFDKKLVLIGNYKNFRTKDSEVISLINELGDDIIFTGYIDNILLYNYIYHASLLVQPSIYEGYGLPPLEALYLGTPVLLSDIPVFKEIYTMFNVSFFSVGNSNELAKSLLNFPYKDQVKENKEKITSTYSYKKSASIIIKSFTGF